MGRRTYGSNVENNIVIDEVVAEVDSLQTDDDNNEVSKKFDIKLIILVIVLSICCVIGCIVFVLKVFDVNKGASMPEDAAKGYIQAIADGDEVAFKRYLPPIVRDEGYVADTNNLSEIKMLDEKYDIDIGDIVVIIDSANLNIDDLEVGFYELYGKDISIKDAVKLSASTTMSYKIDDKSYDTDLVFNLVSIKVGFKWYIYTANLVSDDYDDKPELDEDVSIDESELQTKDENFEIVDDKGVIEYVSPINKDLKPLSKYETVRTDLTNGSVNIDGVDYLFPVLYSDMISLYTLVDESIDEDMRLIEPNYILKNLPIEFVNKDYGMTDFHVSIANSTKENIDVSDGIVTTFYIGLPKSRYSYQIYNYPDVYLPGNITLTSSYKDVVNMYGDLEEYTGNNDSLYMYSDNVKVYYVNLHGNKRNKLYFEFEKDVLVAVQWYFYDLNKF